MLKYIRYQSTTDTKLGHHRNAPRFWVQGNRLTSIGATFGTAFDAISDPNTNSLTILITESGTRRVSGNEARPVIDINTATILGSLGPAGTRLRAVFEPGKITVTVHPGDIAARRRIDRLLTKIANGIALDTGSVFHGAGILDHALASGLADAGIKSRLAFAIELEEKYLDASIRNNPIWDENSIAINASIDEIDFKDIPEVDELNAGIPCTGASLSGRAKNKHLDSAEAHPDAGHLFVAFLSLVAAANPALINLENVVPYRTTPSYQVIKRCLDTMGYDIHETVLDGHELGALENRKRLYAVAVTKGLNLHIDLSQLTAPVSRPASVAEILDPPETEHLWSECTGLKAKAIRDAAKVAEAGTGTGFQMQIVTAESTTVPVAGKSYSKWRSTEPKFSDPSKPGLLRQFSPAEHARVKGIPFELVAGSSPTTQHEMLGQSVIHPAFRAAGIHLGNALSGRTRPTALPQTLKISISAPKLATSEPSAAHIVESAKPQHGRPIQLSFI